MSADFEDLLRAALLDPAAEQRLVEAHTADAVAVIAAWPGNGHRLQRHGPVAALAAARGLERAFLSPLEGRARLIRRLRDGLLLVFDAPADALLATLDGLGAARRWGATLPTPLTACAGLDAGPLLFDPAGDAVGLPVNLALHLAGVAEPGELLCTEAYLARLGAPPSGVGAHRARASRIAHVGLPFHVLDDYRA